VLIELYQNGELQQLVEVALASWGMRIFEKRCREVAVYLN
jgi:hypothetical protein